MHVTFIVAGREFIARLDHVREVVRGASVERLPGCTPPFVGALQLRGVTVPVADARPAFDGSCGDVLVLLEPGREVLGVIVDRVVAVDDSAELDGVAKAPDGLPPYVRGLVEVDGEVRSLVDLRALAASAAEGRAAMLAAGLLPQT
jgi:chemotaxis signal transduction protein